MARELRFTISMSRDKAMRYYQGQAHAIVVTAHNGQRIQFPAKHIRPFIDHSGVNGVFIIRFSDDNKLLDLTKIA